MVGAAVPSWVVPGREQVVDCRRLAGDGADRPAGAASYEAGVVGTLDWVAGLGRSPVTDADLSASAEAAEAEFFAAGEVEFGVSRRGAVVSAEAAQGVSRTLAWLLGWEQRPPVSLPRRPVPTAEQLYEEALAAEPHRTWLPEERNGPGRRRSGRQARLGELAARAHAPGR